MKGFNVLTHKKGNEVYLFGYRDHQCDEVCNTIARFAANPALWFTWRDADQLGDIVRQREQLIQLTNRMPLEDEYGKW